MKGYSGKKKPELIAMIQQEAASKKEVAVCKVDLKGKNVNPKESPKSRMAQPFDKDAFQHMFHYMKEQLVNLTLIELVSKLHAINKACKGAGAGLSGGTFIDMFVTQFLSSKVHGFMEYHSGESDCMINNYPLSLKKINGKTTIALNWSKNGEDSKKCESFNTDMMIINLKTEQWWKKMAPSDASKEEVESKFFLRSIKAGIYFVSRTYCKANVCLMSNNKTDTLINNVQLYKMLIESMKNNMMIEFPEKFPVCKFNILKAFSDEEEAE